MSTRKTTRTTKQRRTYTDEFKRDAVNLVTQQRYSLAALPTPYKFTNPNNLNPAPTNTGEVQLAHKRIRGIYLKHFSTEDCVEYFQ